jgi:hypothetical protein
MHRSFQQTEEGDPMKSKRILFLSLVLVLIALLLTASVVFAKLKITAQPLNAWDWVTNRYENGNANLWMGHWEPMYVQFDTFDNDLVADACGAGTSTKYAGTALLGLGNLDTNGATGFTATRYWRLTVCPPPDQGQPPPAVWCPTCILQPNPLISDKVDTGACTGSTCAKELLNEFFVNIDTNCDGTPDEQIPASGMCLYWEAWSPGPSDAGFSGWWAGNLQARVNVGGGDKTLNFSVAGPNAVALRLFAARTAVPGVAYGFALVALVGVGAVGLVYRRRMRS